MHPYDFIIYHPLAKEMNPTPDIQFSFRCFAANDEIVINNARVAFNKTIKQWELSPNLLNRSKNKERQALLKKTIIVNQLKAKNTQGWVVTNFTIIGNDGSRARELSFCLIDNKTQKALCGNGIVVYFPDDPEVTKINYEPIVLKFLKSIEFVSEEKLLLDEL